MKLFYSIISFFVLLVTVSCHTTTNTGENQIDSTSVPLFAGRCYLQPLHKITALSFASSKTTVFFDFLDSTYCNITINSAVGNIVQSRKYTIDSNRILTLFNPINDKKVAFKLSINSDSTVNLKDMNGANKYKLIPCDSKVNSIFLSENQLKKQEFLYPTLTEKEREFGAESQYSESQDGKITVHSNPLRHEVIKINIYRLF